MLTVASFTMPNGPHNRAKREHLAMHMATGGSVAAFARTQEIPRRTCYLWTKEQGFTQKVSDYRAKVVDRLVGSLAKLGKAAVKEIGILATKADSENVRLAACRAILNDLISVSEFAATAKQLATLEDRLSTLEKATADATTGPIA